jgi:hypothetical protein
MEVFGDPAHCSTPLVADAGRDFAYDQPIALDGEFHRFGAIVPITAFTHGPDPFRSHGKGGHRPIVRCSMRRLWGICKNFEHILATVGIVLLIGNLRSPL